MFGGLTGTGISLSNKGYVGVKKNLPPIGAFSSNSNSIRAN